MATDFGQHVRLVGADIKDLLIFLCRESVEAYGKHRQFARAAGGFKQTIRVSVIACWGIGLDITHAFNVIMIVGVTAIVLHVGVVDTLVVELAEDLLRRDAKIDPQMVHQLELAVFINTRKQRHFGIRRAALHQRTAGVIADPANHRRANTGGTNHRMRLTTERLERFFQ
ncbi:hypothetical protein D3C71_945960 [compost metagenome]